MYYLIIKIFKFIGYRDQDVKFCIIFDEKNLYLMYKNKMF